MLGVLANTDGRAEAAERVISSFAADGVTFLIHCGDIGGRHVLDAMAAMGGVFVWGDRDHDRTALMRHGHRVGLLCFGMMAEFEHEEKKIMVIHGDDKAVLKKLIDEQQYDYLLTGHHMQAEDQMVGKTRILNPGTLVGPNASAMILDVFSGKVKIVAL
jgi:putative phosphoesterase